MQEIRMCVMLLKQVVAGTWSIACFSMFRRAIRLVGRNKLAT